MREKDQQLTQPIISHAGILQRVQGPSLIKRKNKKTGTPIANIADTAMNTIERTCIPIFFHSNSLIYDTRNILFFFVLGIENIPSYTNLILSYSSIYFPSFIILKFRTTGSRAVFIAVPPPLVFRSHGNSTRRFLKKSGDPEGGCPGCGLFPANGL